MCWLLLLLLVINTDAERDYHTFAKSTYSRNISSVALGLGITNLDHHFQQFMTKHNKSYDDVEEIEYRKARYLYSYKTVLDNKRDFQSGIVPYELELNEFSDWSLVDHSFLRSSRIHWPKPVLTESHTTSDIKLPQHFDWREKNIMNPVGSQGSCGSCWVFSAVSVIEAVNAMAGNPLVLLSKQHPLDCIDSSTNQYVSSGCDGGFASDVFKYAAKHGIPMDRDDPYQGDISGSCKEKTAWRQWIVFYNNLPLNSTDELIMEAIYTYGPVSVIINANDRNFILYKGGILTNPGSNDLNTDQNHYLTLVGWGTSNGYNYWIARNSWGVKWGEEGHVRLLRGVNSHGLNSLVSFAKANFTNNRPDDCEPNATRCGAVHFAKQTPYSLLLILLLAILLNSFP